LRVAGLDGAMDRRRAAPARQQRGVDVDAAAARQVEHGLRQDQAVGGHHQQIRRGGQQGLPRGIGVLGELAVRAQTAWLGDSQATVQRLLLDRRRLQLHAAPGGAVGLGQHQRHLVASVGQGGQRGAGELGCPGECDPHASFMRLCSALRGSSSASWS
jgi:hypothetical protein